MLVCVGTGPVASLLTMLVTHAKIPRFWSNKTDVIKDILTEWKIY